MSEISSDSGSSDVTSTIELENAVRTILDKRSITRNLSFPIYHYCSAATALSILQNKTLRFSDISLLNDAEERLWGENKVFNECLRRLKDARGVPLQFPQIDDNFLERIEEDWHKASSIARFLACCFSKNGDSLSQWRSYADDGAGLSLGFSPRGVDRRFVKLEVEYDNDCQIEEMFDALSKLYNYYKIYKNSGSIWAKFVVHLVMRSNSFKNAAFATEEEIRLLHVAVINEEDGKSVLRSATGTRDIPPDQTKIVSFEARRGAIVPYVDFPFAEHDGNMELTNVYLGPKCKSSPDDISILLGSLGYANVTINTAGAKYR